MSRLDDLKQNTSMDVITQCEIVNESLSRGGGYMENLEGLALFLGVSKSKLSQMSRVHQCMLDEVKQYFRNSSYQVYTAYVVACRSPEEQLEWLASRQ